MILFAIIFILITYIVIVYFRTINNDLDILDVPFQSLTAIVLNIRTPIIISEYFENKYDIITNFDKIDNLFIYTSNTTNKQLLETSEMRISSSYAIICNDTPDVVKICIKNNIDQLLYINILKNQTLIVPYGWSVINSTLDIVEYYNYLMFFLYFIF